jgi:predicted enzyme related to lactoylglutathione lyase
MSSPSSKTAVKVKEVAFTCYPVKDMKRARQFYEGLLNLSLASAYEMGPNCWVEYDLSGSTFTLGYMEGGPEPSTHGGMLALEVEHFENTIEALKAAGTVFRMEPFETPGCRMAVVLDSEGNSLMIHQLKVNQLKQEPCHD